MYLKKLTSRMETALSMHLSGRFAIGTGLLDMILHRIAVGTKRVAVGPRYVAIRYKYDVAAGSKCVAARPKYVAVGPKYVALLGPQGPRPRSKNKSSSCYPTHNGRA